MEQRAQGTLQIWAEPFVPLRVPKLFNLRTDPFERADVTSNTYYDWFVDNDYIALAATAVVTQFLETFKEFPPRQEAPSFTIDQVVKKLETFLTAGQSSMSEPLASWNEGSAKAAVLEFVERVSAEGIVRPKSGSRSSTTTARSGARSRCRSSSASSSQRLAEMAEPGPIACANTSRGRPRTRRTTPGWATVIDEALPGRRQRREGAAGRHPARIRGHDGRRLRGRRGLLPR